MLVLLVGPKGSGKSHIGHMLEQRLGIHFVHVEPLWIRYHADCAASGRSPSIPEGIATVHPRIADALRVHEHVSVETTAASPEILADLLSLEPPARTLVARVWAPLELCLERIAGRDPTNQLPADVESVRAVHARSVAAPVPADITLDNTDLGDADIVSAFAAALARRR